MEDRDYMKLALDLARKGMGRVNPNPLVGAVVVKDGAIVSTGYHKYYGGWHAERNALSQDRDFAGATLYVNLEPCCHYGKTPPCTQIIIEKKIARVVIGMVDPNPKVSYKGVEILKGAGIEVVTGVLEAQCRDLNEPFIHFIKNKTPFVVLKYAMTLDGKIATVAKKSKWITNEKSRELVHHYRHRYQAIMVGVNTVIIDDPMLDCRLENGADPIRIVCDTKLRMPLDSRIVKTATQLRTIVATANQDPLIRQLYLEQGCEVLVVDLKEDHLDLNDLMVKLGHQNIDSILLEGGATLNFSALKSKIVNQVKVFIAPKIFGGQKAPSPVGGPGMALVESCFNLADLKVTPIAGDILIEGEVR